MDLLREEHHWMPYVGQPLGSEVKPFVGLERFSAAADLTSMVLRCLASASHAVREKSQRRFTASVLEQTAGGASLFVSE